MNLKIVLNLDNAVTAFSIIGQRIGIRQQELNPSISERPLVIIIVYSTLRWFSY